MALTVAQAQYINWLRKNDPFLLAVAVKRATGKNIPSNTLDGFTDAVSDVFSSIKNVDFGKLVTTITDTAAKIATTASSLKIVKAQTQRAISGQPPIDVNMYSSAPQYDPNSPEGRLAVDTAASKAKNSDTLKSVLPWVAVGIGGILLYSFLGRKAS